MDKARKKLKKPKLFTMYRKNDTSGVSGTGRVLDGVVFHTGICVVAWRTRISSIAVYDTFDHFKAFVEVTPIYKNYILSFGRISPYKGLKYLVN